MKSNPDEKDNVGIAQLALASCYESSNKQTLAISYLELFISHAQGNLSQRLDEAKACNQLAILLTKLGKYNSAESYFERQYCIISSIKDASVTKSSSTNEIHNFGLPAIQLGIAKAQSKLEFLFETVADPSGISALLKWKESRTFGDYLPPSKRVVLNKMEELGE